MSPLVKSIFHHSGEKWRPQNNSTVVPRSTKDFSNNDAFHAENSPSTCQFYGVMLAFCLAYFSNQYSISIIAVHLYAIGEVFEDYKQVVWFVNGASLGVVILGPTVFYYSTMRTRKWFILFGLLAGMGGQLIAGLARGMHILIVGQAFLGITLSTQPLLVMIPVELLSRKHRKLAQLLSNIAGGLGGICGAVIGGAILRTRKFAGDIFPWQWLFRLAAILYGFTFILLLIMYQTRPLEICAEAGRKKAKFDWVGVFFLTAGIVPLVTGASIGGEPTPWNTLPVILTLVCGGTFLFLFVIWELWGTSSGLFHHELFIRGRNFPIALVLTFLEGILFVAFLVWYNQEVSILFESRPLIQGSRFAIFYGIIIILAPCVAMYYSRTKNIRLPLASGFLLVMVAGILMATLTLGDSKISMFYSALAATGLTAPLVLLATIVHLCAPPKLTCVVTPLAALIRVLGIITGNVLSNTTINSRYNTLVSRGLAELLPQFSISTEDLEILLRVLRMRDMDLIADVASELKLPSKALQEVEKLAAEAQMDAFRIVWIVVAVLACLGAIGCVAMRAVDERQPNSAIPAQTITFPSNSIANAGSLNTSGTLAQYDDARVFDVIDIRRDPEKMGHDL